MRETISMKNTFDGKNTFAMHYINAADTAGKSAAPKVCVLVMCGVWCVVCGVVKIGVMGV